MSDTSDHVPYIHMLPVTVPNDVPLGVNILFGKQCDHCLSRNVDCKYSRSVESTMPPTRCDSCWINGRTCTYNLLSAYGGLTIEDDMPLSALAYMDRDGFRINPRLQGRDLVLAEGAIRYFLAKSSPQSYSVLAWPCDVFRPIFGDDEAWPILEHYNFPEKSAMRALSIEMLGYTLQHRCRPPVMPWVVEACGTGMCLPIAPFRHLDYLRPRVSPLWQHEGPVRISWLQPEITGFQQSGSPGWHPLSRPATPPPAYPQLQPILDEAGGETRDHAAGTPELEGGTSHPQPIPSTTRGVDIELDGNFGLRRPVSSPPRIPDGIVLPPSQSITPNNENTPEANQAGAGPSEADGGLVYIDVGGAERRLNQVDIGQVSAHRSRYLGARHALLAGSPTPCWQLYEMGSAAMDEELVTNLPFGLLDLTDSAPGWNIRNVDFLRDGMGATDMMVAGWHCWDLAARAETPRRGGEILLYACQRWNVIRFK
ncbi:uncharacterized protein BXZ73DRAFT_84600 [Epithele typhae]|uniref:uncharacterized protein n=1 Tax=Epithele typhae TaxID=378194 RepID=UPI002007F8F2|nr:uncharacterized protein BXZ73DRAFT_84600 [Epithele typhae]KAH9907640.1 hypothetical protein BXZ73DRAFT_84600 [Epithele typhae]